MDDLNNVISIRLEGKVDSSSLCFSNLEQFFCDRKIRTTRKDLIEKDIVIEILKTSLDTFDANVFFESEELFKMVEEYEQRGTDLKRKNIKYCESS